MIRHFFFFFFSIALYIFTVNFQTIHASSKKQFKESTRERMKKIVSYVLDNYKQDIEDKGYRIVIDLSDQGVRRHDGSPYQTMATTVYPHKPDEAYFVIDKWYASNRKMTNDVFALTLCHEIGHYLGGAPKIIKGRNDLHDFSFLTGEGQADYWSSLKCIRDYFSKVSASKKAQRLVKKLPNFLKNKCKSVYSPKKEVDICVRSIAASIRFSELMHEIYGYSFQKPPSPSTPSSDIATKTLRKRYPTVQCRLDTHISAALCNIPSEIKVDDKNPFTGVCSQQSGDLIGYRPKCWFNENEFL